MKKEYDFTKGRKNPYLTNLKKTISPLQEFFRKKSLEKVFIALIELNKVYFDAYLKPDFLERKDYYAKLFFRKRQILFKSLQKMRARNQTHQEIIKKIEHIYETIFSLHLLRFRVTDFTIFAICRQDMQSILQLMTELLQSMLLHTSRRPAQVLRDPGTASKHFWIPRTSRGTTDFSADRLLAAIHIFETIYHQTLKIVSPDPSIFLFFIQDCYTLSDEIENLSNLLWHPK